ncbi:hypothetical protein CSUI_008691 [Cystoisospora suis]|uniref:Uncharacterized protein n=1 Tax=Cystoisospora suis TaxID=483139 RepID=A0A2C6KK33_9APIC|nr:hypothetical protein CSUI_008691 [Cystoisospora suis]
MKRRPRILALVDNLLRSLCVPFGVPLPCCNGVRGVLSTRPCLVAAHSTTFPLVSST